MAEDYGIISVNNSREPHGSRKSTDGQMDKRSLR